MSITRLARPALRGVILSAILFAAPLFALAGCGPSIPNVTITAKDFSFQMPTTFAGGLVAITLHNAGKEPHQANLARLNKGVTPAILQAALRQGPDVALPLVTFVGGPNTVDAGQSQRVVVNLPAGAYVALCFVTSPNGKSHVEEGMVQFFKVTAPPSDQPSAPDADATVTLKDFSIAVPGNIQAGTVTWKVTNAGPEPHEMALLKMAQGKDVRSVEAYLQQPSGPPPFADAGGMAALAPGSSGWATLDLGKGTYVALCFVPAPKTGKAHYELGMIAQFTVH